MIIDSKLTVAQALDQNPAKPLYPKDVVDCLGLMEVQYWGFDGQPHQGQIVVGQAVMTEIESFFKLAYELRFPIAKVVPPAAPEYRWDAHKLVEQDNVTHGFVYRTIKNTNKLSSHAYGLAIDVNPIQNPYTWLDSGAPVTFPAGCVWNPDVPGTLHAAHPLVKLMEGYGWQWGGRWTLEQDGKVDYMHFHKSR